ncbi:MAG: SH3 domain-containing protein [Pseudomonadales bacterium]
MMVPTRTTGRTFRRLQGLRLLAVTLLAVVLPMPAAAWFERYQPTLVVSDPFIDMHTGPGRGYPVFYVAGAGDEIVVLKRRTDWYKIRGPRDKEGWVHVDQLRRTLDLDGEAVDFGEVGFAQYAGRRWEAGMTGGDFAGARTLSGYVGYVMTPNITLQLEGTQILGDFSDGLMGTASILMYPFPAWRLSPYFTIGTGIIRTEPQTTIVRAEDREDEIVHAGVGANLHLSDRFILRVEYKRHTVLTSRDDNEEIDQWKAGFSVFF